MKMKKKEKTCEDAAPRELSASSQALQPLASVAAKTWKEKMGKMERERGEGERGDEDKEKSKKDEDNKRERK